MCGEGEEEQGEEEEEKETLMRLLPWEQGGEVLTGKQRSATDDICVAIKLSSHPGPDPGLCDSEQSTSGLAQVVA